MNDEKQLTKIIIERMMKKSGVPSQAQLARNVLRLQPPRITDAIQKGKIPDRWFDIMEEKFGVSREELCRPSTKVRAAVAQPYGDAPPDEERDHCLRELNSLFQIIVKWQEDENGLDSLTSMNFIREFHERFPELGDWLKKQKGQDNKSGVHQNIIGKTA